MTMIPSGFRLAGARGGLKEDPQAEDTTLIVTDRPCIAAGVYTQNQVVAAPVSICQQRTPSDHIRAIVANSGNANACTGSQGMMDARRMLEITASEVGCHPNDVLVMSTGIIGELLPMEQITSGIRTASRRLDCDHDALLSAARGILTTDTRPKIAHAGEGNIHVTGIAKGAGMIAPNMATMLGVILTDAAVLPAVAQDLLRDAVDKSFNAISVDGHTSTNDTVLLLASGDPETALDQDHAQLAAVLESVCVDLARQLVDDGEGASHLVEIDVVGAQNEADAHVIAQAIADSPLVKTAIAGNDPNWGRIISAAGYAGPRIDVDALELAINGIMLFRDGSPVEFDAEGISACMKSNRHTNIRLRVGSGDGSSRFWTCDLTHEYVTINAEYHT